MCEGESLTLQDAPNHIYPHTHTYTHKQTHTPIKQAEMPRPSKRWQSLALPSCCLLALFLVPLLISEAFLFPQPHPHKEIQQQQQQQIQQHPTNNHHHLTHTISRRRGDPAIMATCATTFSSSASPTAKDKLVVLTREAGKNDKLRARLEAREVQVLELPCIAHCHAEGYAKLQEILDTVAFDYVVITSPEVRGWCREHEWRRESVAECRPRSFIMFLYTDTVRGLLVHFLSYFLPFSIIESTHPLFSHPISTPPGRSCLLGSRRDLQYLQAY